MMISRTGKTGVTMTTLKRVEVFRGGVGRPLLQCTIKKYDFGPQFELDVLFLSNCSNW